MLIPILKALPAKVFRCGWLILHSGSYHRYTYFDTFDDDDFSKSNQNNGI